MAHWIVIADASGARIFSLAGATKPLELVREIGNPQGRLRTHDLVTDQPGRVNKAGSPGTRSAAEPRTSAHEESAEEFARRLARFLGEEGERQAYKTLSIAASPHFLGLLRESLSKEVDHRVRATVAGDLTHVPADELRNHIGPLLPAGLFL
ncbi:MAG TPA: host attachment protein [Tepidisphaeraceae bacterium]|nr:host attachment protein [Tepidisphaeraceae bacterium]